jgi:hypothetical protein
MDGCDGTRIRSSREGVRNVQRGRFRAFEGTFNFVHSATTGGADRSNEFCLSDN